MNPKCICPGGPQISVDANNNAYWVHDAQCGLPSTPADQETGEFAK